MTETVKGEVQNISSIGVIRIDNHEYAPTKKYRDMVSKVATALDKYKGQYVELTIEDSIYYDIKLLDKPKEPKEITVLSYADMLKEYEYKQLGKPNIYAKLQRVRCALQNYELKKSGNNKFANYTYYELGDFLPTINNLFNEYRLTSIISFGQDLATMTIINTENPQEMITITSPMEKVELKGCHSIQNLGAVETYQRRYLYMTALEIVEHDALDSVTGKGDK